MMTPIGHAFVNYLQLPVAIQPLQYCDASQDLEAKKKRVTPVESVNSTKEEEKEVAVAVAVERALEQFKSDGPRLQRIFSLLGSPLIKTPSLLASFVDSLSVMCASPQMKWTELNLSIRAQDATHLAALIGDSTIHADDSLCNKLQTVLACVMTVPSNKLAILHALIDQTSELGVRIATELDQIYKIIGPCKPTIRKFADHRWTIDQAKQNTLLRKIEFVHCVVTKMIDNHIRNVHVNTNANEEEKTKQEKSNAFAKTQSIFQKACVNATEQQQALRLFEVCNRNLEPLWKALDLCLTMFGFVPKDKFAVKKMSVDSCDMKLESGISMLAATSEEETARMSWLLLRFKPLLLTFFLLHDFYHVDLHTKSSPEEMEFELESQLANAYLLECHKYFLDFTDRHRHIFNLLIAQNPILLTGIPRQQQQQSPPKQLFHGNDTKNDNGKLGPFAALLWHPKRVLDLENKKKYLHLGFDVLRRECFGYDPSQLFSPKTNLEVRRDQLFNDSFCQMKLWTKQELMNRLSIRFIGEEGVDASGLTREWYCQMTKSMFDPSYALFIPAGDNNNIFQPNPHSSFNSDHIENFKFVGLFVAKAIFDGQTLEAYFSRPFLKHILHVQPTWEDLQSLDYTHYKNLKWMLENPIAGLVDLDFTYEIEKMGTIEKVELKPHGDKLPVTDSNKREFVELISDSKMTKLVKDQIDAFLKGFHILIPHWLTSIFTWSELDLLICGMPEIDIVDWQNNTQYFGRYTKDSPQIKWFWETVQEMDKEEQALLLQFMTGTSRMPLGGFASLPGFQIHSSSQTDETLPSAHTCFNQLDLPTYSTKEVLKKKLSLAIRECSQGFGFV
ncbi:hypothetical protein RFI_23811 [Reticulomyxa filosa]|uniref:HECT-type E3 ubiquitin transferase n=1 Tax=Reticulomyxa filosa TaxID=46433 RepID=X6MI63_RETFI|nr:hypothetical protein RFI_23811 [Reticulomyxa filosa]|eukprot:ETO13559.1 hypothetical protein RFI_23811 [Reticulomyxa filosa]